MKLHAPNITPGPWLQDGFYVTTSEDQTVCECVAGDQVTDAKAIANLPAAYAALAELVEVAHRKAKSRNGDEMASAIVDSILAEEKAQAALLAAGYTIEP